jgi:hypothetical protein
MSWLKIVELLVVVATALPSGTLGHKGISTHITPKVPYFDKSAAMISTLVNKTWFSWYPHCQHVIDDNGSEFKLHIEALCDTYGIKRKLTSVKNPQVNAILQWVHQVIMAMLHTSELDMTASVDANDIDTFLTNVTWAICPTYHAVLKVSLGTAIFSWDMLPDIPFLADWNKIGDYRQCQTDFNTAGAAKLQMTGIIKSAKTYCYGKMEFSTNQKACMNVIHGLSHLFIQMAQLGFNVKKSERINIRRGTPYFNNLN